MSDESLSKLVSNQLEHPRAQSIHLSLRQQPSSKAAKETVYRIVPEISGRETPWLSMFPFGAVITDILKGLALVCLNPTRPMKSD